MKHISDFILESTNQIISADQLLKNIIDSWGGNNNEDLINGYVRKVELFLKNFGNKFQKVTDNSIIEEIEEVWMDEGGGAGEYGIDLRKEDVGQGILLDIELDSKEYIGNCYGYDTAEWYEVL